MSKPRGIYFDSQLLFSKAYLELRPSAIHLLNLAYSKRIIVTRNINRKKQKLADPETNIFLVYKKISKEYGYAPSTISGAISQLIEVGFLDVLHEGGRLKGDATIYRISQRFLTYGTPEFKSILRSKDTRKLGFAAVDWEKATGRKRKSKPTIENNSASTIKNNSG